MRVVLISCVKSKLARAAPASDLYTSALFKGSLRYARKIAADAVFVLSAKYGLVPLSQVIEPYQQTLKGQPVKVLREWSASVASQLSQHTDLKLDHFIILAGEPYRRFLVPYLTNVEVPLAGKGFGEQLRFYSQIT